MAGWTSAAEGFARQRHLPLLVVAVHRAGMPVFSTAAGANADQYHDVALDTVFRVASITKIVTAATILCLEREGLLQLDDPVAEYFPSFPSSITTIRDLLVHGSGLQREAPGETGWITGRFLLDGDLERAVVRAEHVLPRMSRWKYSNLGYNVLGFVARNVTAAPFEATAAAKVLDPLGMSTSTFAGDGDPVAGLTQGHRRRRQGGVEPDPWFFSRVPAPAGGLYSTARDLGRLAAFLTGALPGSIHDAVRTAMCRPVLAVDDNPTQAQGMGPLVIHGPRGARLGHAGGLTGYGSYLLAEPSTALSVVALTNLGDATGLFELCGGLLDEAGDLAASPVVRTRVPPPEGIGALVGRYWGDGTALVLSWDGDGMIAQWEAPDGMLSPAMPFDVEGPDLLRTKAGPFLGEMAVVERDDLGEVVRLRISGYVYERA